MQCNNDGISAWAEEWKISLNKGKTNVMVISTSQKDLDQSPNLHLNKTPHETVREYHFLCITISNDLRFQPYVKSVVAKRKRRLKILKSLAENLGSKFRLLKILVCDIHQGSYGICCPGLVPLEHEWLRMI